MELIEPFSLSQESSQERNTCEYICIFFKGWKFEFFQPCLAEIQSFLCLQLKKNLLRKFSWIALYIH